MSFYGSIYYQLIDAFYKVVLRNRGKNSTEFIDASNLPESFETQAAGRKSVFGFDTGNKWINLNERTEVNPAANEAYSIYEIYHGAPDTEKENPGYGFKVILDDSTLNNRTTDGIIQLDFNDEFETYETVYDDAGHISSSERKVYRLPKAEVNERIDKLENLVGLPDSYKNLPEVNEKHQHLYGYVDENSKDIKLLEDYVGTWSSIVGNWKKGGKYAPTVSQVIGNIDGMYGSSFEDRIDKHKTLAEIIGDKTEGNLPALYKKLNDENPISLIKAILKESGRIDTLSTNLTEHQNASNGAFAGIDARIGKSIIEGDSIYDHIIADRNMMGEPIDNEHDIYDHISILYDNMNWPNQSIGQQKITVSGEINRLDNKIGNLNNAGTEGSSVTVTSEINRLDGKIGNVPSDVTSLREYVDNNFEDIDEILTYDLGDNYAVDEQGTQTNTAFGLIKNNADDISSINKFIGKTESGEPDENSLLVKITDLQNFVGGEALASDEESLKTHIDNIKNYVGYTVSGQGESLTDQINSFGELLGGTSLETGEDNLITRINNLEDIIGSNEEFSETTIIDSIVSLNNNIGTNEDDNIDTLYGKINNVNDSLGKLTLLVGGSELAAGNETLISQVSKIHNDLYVSDENKGTKSLVSKVSECQDFVNKYQNLIGEPSEGASNDSLFTQIEDIKKDIGVLAEVTTSHEFGEDVTVNNISDVLNNILTRLENLENEVKNLKTETPDVPDSDNPEDEQEPNV